MAAVVARQACTPNACHITISLVIRVDTERATQRRRTAAPIPTGSGVRPPRAATIAIYRYITVAVAGGSQASRAGHIEEVNGGVAAGEFSNEGREQSIVRLVVATSVLAVSARGDL